MIRNLFQEVLGCLEAAGNHSWGEECGTIMKELGVVITWVPAVLRPQIQEAASVPSTRGLRLLQRESRLHAGRQSTALPLNIPMAAVVWVPS